MRLHLAVLHRVVAVLFCALCAGLAGCNGINTPGRMEWVQPTTTTPRVGTVYLIRGWMGIYSAGIDEMAQQLRDRGVTAYVYMPEQYPELANRMVEVYKDAPWHEPICFVGHSRGVDSSIIISRKLNKVNVPVDLIVCLDSVDETTLTRNVRLCYNYWMPGIFWDSNLLRGIPLKQEPGSTGKLYNYNLDSKEYIGWREPLTDHVSFDDDPMVQQRIINNILEVCVERARWTPPVPAPVSPPPPAAAGPATPPTPSTPQR
jgi:hypothetical protein